MTEQIFTSKANSLAFFKDKIHKSTIEPFLIILVSEWKNNSSSVLQKISKQFDNLIIVRSSGSDEDSLTNSNAGNYSSILNVSSKSPSEVKHAIESVISSYRLKGNLSLQNQILIQKQTKNVITSGVIFTRSNDIGSPYFIINYEDGHSTDGVTHGKTGKTIKIYRKSTSVPIKWKSLLSAVSEIEILANSTILDLEFAIQKNKNIVIFQVRPLTTIKNTPDDKKIHKCLTKCKREFGLHIKKHQDYGNITIFSDMTDWNPAEIIGSSPNLLDYSLYDYIIMKDAWHKGRGRIGYQKISSYPLMQKFGNKPYVDIRASFNSLIPDQIPNKIKKKLLKYYIEKLRLNPELYDKAEFEILFTCYDLTIQKRLKQLSAWGFDKNEISSIRMALLDFTNNLIKMFPAEIQNCKELILQMTQSRNLTLKQLSDSKKSYVDLLESAELLLKNCKQLGTIPFSTVARIAFISTAILKSLLKLNYIDSNYYDHILNSIHTPVSQLQMDYSKLHTNNISKKDFLSKYGHLRPGTYDIIQRRYDQNNPYFTNIQYLKIKKNKKINYKTHDLDIILKKHSLYFESLDFVSFLQQSLSMRELLKFEFTKNLSDAIECIAKAGKLLGFSREEICNLDLKFILKSFKNYSKKDLQSIWTTKIKQQQQTKSLLLHLLLPPLITRESDFDHYEYSTSKPNYITSSVLTADSIYLENKLTMIPLSKKIILLENADPGYDWIFTKDIGGLITQYGGAASHMAIRCSELGIPAAIGCGEIIFDDLKNSDRIMMDCKNEQVLSLEGGRKNEVLEAKKALKSLGYIR